MTPIKPPHCKHCQGTGWEDNLTCSECHGVKVPPTDIKRFMSLALDNFDPGETRKAS